jgi:ABC-type arginine transport system ATPase subunit
MVELFSGLPPGHEFFAQYSFIRQEDLPQFEAILKRITDVGLRGLDEAESRLLLSLPFKLVAAKHRLGLIDESFEARVIEARRHFAANLPQELRRAVEFFDPARYNGAASLQDNILFGKIVTGQAEAATRITALVRELLDELGLRPLVVKIGLDYHVGVGGARLPVADRQKTALVRALLKRPVVLVLDQATAVLDPASQGRVFRGILAERKGRGVLWVLQRPEAAERFSSVLVMERGRLVEQGLFENLKCSGGTLHKMLAPS